MNNDKISFVGETKGDEYLDVTFFKDYLNDGDGHIADEETDFIRISAPGDDTLVIVHQLDEHYKARFKTKYEAYCLMQQVDGTPLTDWDELPKGMRSAFEKQGFKFIEQIAMIPDATLSKIMGSQQWRTKAKAYLKRDEVSESSTIKAQGDKIKELEEKLQLLMNAMNKAK